MGLYCRQNRVCVLSQEQYKPLSYFLSMSCILLLIPHPFVMSPVPQALASFLAAVLVVIPLPSHWRARNIPTISLIFWLATLNIAHGVNVIIWWGSVQIKLLVWCDIGTL